MAWSFRPGIRTEIVFTLTVLMAGAVALVGVLFLKVEERNLLEQKIKEGKQMVTALQGFLQELNPAGTGSNPAENLPRVVALFAQGHSLLHLSVVDRDFRILADSRPEKIGKVLRDEDLEKAMAAGRMFAHGGGEGEPFSLVRKAPLRVSAAWVLQGRTVGGIRAELPLDDLRETLFRSQTIVFLYVFLTASLLIVMGSFLLSRVIITPLKRLVQMSERIAEGDLKSMTERSGGDEVGRVFSSFNHMASRLREDRAKMEEYIQTLEKVNLELRRAQDEIIRSEKLASIGRLAAGVAHEVGNPTGAILGYLDLLTKGGLSPGDAKEILQRTESEAERIRRIIRELLDFARPSPRLEEEVEVNEVIDRALSLLSHQRKVWEQIRVVKEFQQDLPKWKGDSHQLQQVMINLFLNAADAMASTDLAQTGKEKKLRIITRACLYPEASEFLGGGTPRVHPSGKSRLRFRSRWKIRARGFRRKPGERSSTPFTPPNLRGRAPAWAWPSVSGFWNLTEGGFPLKAKRIKEPDLSSDSPSIRTPMETKKVLVVDDEESMRHMLSLILKREGYEVLTAGGGQEALALVDGKLFDFILMDVVMPGMDGLELLKMIKDRKVEATVIMMSAYGSLETAVEAMKTGAYDYVSKPFKPDEILLTLRKAEERENLRKENVRLRQEVCRDYSFGNIVGKSVKMVQLFETIKKISDYKASVLILGESGTGKEMVARSLHYNSSRVNGPFVAVNCGAIPETLPRRSGGDQPHGSSEAPARPAGRRGETAGERAPYFRGCPDHRRHHQRPHPRRGRGKVPGRSLLPPQCASPPPAAPEGSEGRPSSLGGPFHPEI